MSRQRLRAEECQRLTLADVKPLVRPGAAEAILPDGKPMAIRWSDVKGCFGGGVGRALLLVCPTCQRSSRVLHRKRSRDLWGCWACRPLSVRSHRRSGARRGRSKPRSWHLDRIMAEQKRCIDLLGLASWPPEPLIWSWRHVLTIPRRSGSPRLTERKAKALAVRLDVLDRERLVVLMSAANQWLNGQGQQLIVDSSTLGRMHREAIVIKRITEWAVRRGPCISSIR